MMRSSLILVALMAAGYLCTLRPLYGDEPEEPLPEMRLIIPGPPGATFDRHGRLIARHLGRHLPGRPLVVPQNMPGASGQIAANYLCNVAPQDGSVIGLLLKQLPLMQAIGESVPCDMARVHFIGSPARLPETLVVWHTLGVRTIEEARAREITLGATTPSGASAILPKLANAYLGTRFKLVTGYSGGPQINLAMERSEVEGRASEPWSEWQATKPEWVRERKIVPLLQMGLRKHPDLPHVPLVSELPMSATARAAFELAAITSEISRPLVAPPGVPLARVAQLRAAFRALMRDPEFRAAAARHGAAIDPIDGEELSALVAHVLGATPDAITALKQALR